MKKLYLIIFIGCLALGVSRSFGQSNKKVSGVILDSAKTALADATILLISGKDTLKTSSDGDGRFNITKIKADAFSLQISLVGYREFTSNYSFGKEKNLNLKNIELQIAHNMLKEVVIKSKPNPVRVMQDTIEYNAAAFQVLDGDNVADLIKQFPGLEVDDEYNVKSMGKEVVKLRVNGKDFFTNNPQEFISKLPAGIVSKVQIIDDFGDQANFTGLKIGEPQKMINIVTKPGMNKGTFGAMSVKGGTNSQIGTINNVNLWNDSKQTGGTLNYTTQNNGAGNSENMNINANHYDKLGKNGSYGFNYMGNGNASAFANEQAVETVSSLGSFYNLSQSNGDNKTRGHNLNANINTRTKKLYLNAGIIGGYTNSNNHNMSLNNQSGVLRQDLKNINSSKGIAPNLSANLNVTKILNDKRNSLSANFGINFYGNQSNQQINTNTLYYNQTNNVLLKDSVLNRTISNETATQGFTFSTGYTFILSKPKDTTGTKSLSLNYAAGISRTANDAFTEVLSNLTNTYHYVDSLSNSLRSLSINQTIGLNYYVSKKKYRLTLGFNARPVLLTTDYLILNQRITNNNFNYSPTFNYSKSINSSQTLSFNYNGNNNNPNANQLQPIRNTQNLQNIVIGNPNLKPSFSHTLTTSYNIVKPKSGASLFVMGNFSTTQNEIVNNVVIIPDTLGSFKQETRYENTNGTYNLSGNYNLSYPIVKTKFTIGLNGTMGFSNRAIFINNIRNFNSGLNFSQRVNANLTLKKFNINTSVSFSQVNNNNVLNPNMAFAMGSFNPGQLITTDFFRTRTFSSSLGSRLKLTHFDFNTSVNYSTSNNSNNSLQSGLRNIQNLNLSLNANANINKVYRMGLNASKRINSGFNLNNPNPLLIGFTASRSFFKNKALNINFSGNDLLNQGNNLARYVSGNSVIDSRSNLITRVFSFGLSYNLSKFGVKGQTFKVDPD